jgi:GMP synthase (glutamine-hydrolysing)
MTRTAVAVRHVHFEDLGSFGEMLHARGYAVAYRDAGLDDLASVDALAPDLLVVLGGPIGAYEESAYPFLVDELRLLERRLAAGRPVLGICLGAQLTARALGARVYPGPGKEIGWAPLTLTEAGRAGCLAPFGDGAPVLHWHGDTFDLPEGGTRLASTPLCANQAFARGPAVLGVQFHPEVRGPALERWLIGHAAEIAATAGVTPERLRADTRRFSAGAEARGRDSFARWLEAAGL